MALRQGSVLTIPLNAHAQDATISTATSITVPDSAEEVVIQVNGASARLVLDGSTAATTALGFLLSDGQIYRFPVLGSATISIIETTTTAIVEIQFVE